MADWTVDGSTAFLLALGATLVLVCHRFLRFTVDPREPPVVWPRIPVIGHTIGLGKYGPSYFYRLSQNGVRSIFTMPMVGIRAYVITDAALASSVQRHSREIALTPAISMTAKSMLGVDDRQLSIMNKTSVVAGKEVSMLEDVVSAMKTALAPGLALDALNRSMLAALGPLVDTLSAHGQPTEIHLLDWIRKTITSASTDAMYGPTNPFQKPEIAQAFWDYDADVLKLLIGILPKVLARKGYYARQRAVEALKEYYRNGGVDRAAALIKVRYEGHVKYGATDDDQATFEIGDLIGLLTNSVPTMFWMVVHIFSDPQLLAEIRAEIDQAMSKTHEGNGASKPSSDATTHHVIDMARLKEQCPLLLSTLHEILRYRSINPSVRVVVKDVVIGDRYLLKANSLVQTPPTPFHRNRATWGDNADEFQARRFVPHQARRMNTTSDQTFSKRASADDKSAPQNQSPTQNSSTQTTTKTDQRVPPTAFQAWGSAPWLCPGRHFATAEILALTAMLVARFDINPAADGQPWSLPNELKTRFVAVQPPATDLLVQVKPRKGFEGHHFEFAASPSKVPFALMV